MNDHFRAYFLRRSARMAAKNQDWSKAASFYEALRRTGAARPSDAVRHAKSIESAGRADVAEQVHRDNIALFPLEPNVHRQHGLFLLGRQKEADAILAFARGRMLAPDDEVLKADLERLGVGDDHISAVGVSAFYAASEPSPARPGAVGKFRARRAARTAKALRQSGNWKSALDAQIEVLKHNPHNAYAHIRLGHVLKALNRFQEAETAYWKGVALAPKDASGYLQLGHGLRLSRDFQIALPAYLMAQRLEPSLVEAGSAAKESDAAEQYLVRFADMLATADIRGILTFKAHENAMEPPPGSPRRVATIKPPVMKSINIRAAAIAGDIARAVGVGI